MKKLRNLLKTAIVAKIKIVATFLPDENDTIVILAANVIQVFWSLKDFVSKVSFQVLRFLFKIWKMLNPDLKGSFFAKKPQNQSYIKIFSLPIKYDDQGIKVWNNFSFFSRNASYIKIVVFFGGPKHGHYCCFATIVVANYFRIKTIYHFLWINVWLRIFCFLMLSIKIDNILKWWKNYQAKS